jgi:hypothetical protein
MGSNKGEKSFPHKQKVRLDLKFIANDCSKTIAKRSREPPDDALNQ